MIEFLLPTSKILYHGGESLYSTTLGFKSPFLIDGSIPIVPFTHLVASCNKRPATEHVLGRQTTILQDWSNGCMNVTTFFVTMCDKRNDVLLTDTFCVWQPYARSHALYEFSIRQARGLTLTSFRFHLTMDTLALGYVIPTIRAHSGLAPVRQCSCRTYQMKSV